MPRILGVDLPNDKPTHISLRYIYGIGPTLALRLVRAGQRRSAAPRQGTDRRRNQPPGEHPRPRIHGRRPVAPAEFSRTSPACRTSAAIAACGIGAVCRSAASAPRQTPVPARGREDSGGQEGRQGIARLSAVRRGTSPGYVRGQEQETQGKTKRQQGHRPHQGDVQQHHCHDHRHQRRYAVFRLGGHGRASRAAARARRSPPSGRPRRRPSKATKFGLKEIEVRVKGPGSGRESAITALQAAGLMHQGDRGRDAAAAQRLPPSQETPRVSKLADHRFVPNWSQAMIFLSLCESHTP